MSEHYYSKNPKVNSEPKTWSTSLREQNLHLRTDAGVFSKSDVDFGSRLLVEEFIIPKIEGPLLDIGCGYGPIGLTLALMFPERIVHMIDVNHRALELSKLNAERNDVKNVKIYESESLLSVEESNFAAILTNPPIRAGKKTVFSFYEQAYEKLRESGELWVVIQKKQGAPSTEKHLNELFGNVQQVAKSKGYIIFRAIKSLTI